MKDILVLGKVKQLERARRRRPHHRRRARGRPRDHVPHLGARAARRGARRARSARRPQDVIELLTDPTRCQVVLVTLPEETPVNELVDTAFALEDRVGVALGPVVVNALPGRPRARRRTRRPRRRRADAGASTIPEPTRARSTAAAAVPPRAPRAPARAGRPARRSACPLPQIRLPFLFGEIGPDEIERARRRADRRGRGAAEPRRVTPTRRRSSRASRVTSWSAAGPAASARRRPRRCSRSRRRGAAATRSS